MTTTQLVAIAGNTYPVKDRLKAIGARWNADRKVWLIEAFKEAQAKAIVAEAGAKKPFTGGFGQARSYGSRNFRRRNEDNECDLCGRNKYTCGHCIGW